MTKLEELKAEADTAWVDWVAAKAGADAACDAARDAARDAYSSYYDYKDELKRQENTDD